MAKMTEKQKLFCDEYLIDLNATQAAIRAGYSKKTARNIATENLSKPNIQEYLKEHMKKREERTEITQDSVLKELAAIAFANGSDYAKVIERQAVVAANDGTRIPLTDENGNPIMMQTVELELTDKLTDKQKKAIAGIKQGKNGIEVSTCDKVKALELLGRHLGLFVDNLKVEGESVVQIINDIPKGENDNGSKTD